MFDPLRTEIVVRFTVVESYFKTSRNLEPGMEKVARGMAFVHMYAAYEYTATNVFRAAIDSLVGHNYTVKDLMPSLMGIFLHPQIQSLQNCSAKNEWDCRIDLFQQVFSNEAASVPNTVFPTDGSHFRHRQLQTIFKVLGIDRSPAHRRRHLFRIDEVVDNRNAIAHGRETAEVVGRRYTRAEILHIIRQMRSVCTLVVSVIKAHCDDPTRHCRS